MDPKLLTENGWKAVAAKFKVKDNGLQRALAGYEKFEEDAFADRLKGIGSLIQLTGALKKAKEVAALPDVVKCLTNLLAAAQAEQRDVTKAKADAEKAKTLAAKAEALTQKKADEEAKQREQEEDGDEEEEEGDTFKKLTNSLKTLKLSKKPYYFLVCDAKPYGLVISKKDIRKSTQARKELSQIAGGSTRPPKFGECHCDSGKYVFEMEKPPSGLARILQKWIKDNTGLGIKVMVGTESAEDPEEQPATGEQEEDQTQSEEPAATEPPAEAPEAEEPEEPTSGDAAPPPAAESRPGRPTLARAPEVWQQTQRDISAGIEQLKTAIRKEFADEGPELAAEIDQKMEKLDGILDNLDAKLTDSLTKANAAANAAARANELEKTKTILAGYIKFVRSEPLIAQIDSNPFGVKINLKKRLTDTLTHVAQAIGR